MGKDIQRKINGVGQWIVSLMFQFGVWLTKILLFIVEQSFSLDIIDVVADKLGKAMQNIAGIEVNRNLKVKVYSRRLLK